MNRQCTKCLVTKDVSEFYPQKKGRDGLQGNCKECHRKTNRDYMRARREKENPNGRRNNSITNSGPDYIRGAELHCELIVSKAQGYLTRKAEKMLALICRGVIRKFSYTDEDDRADCLSEAYLVVFRNWYNYNELVTENAFAYITEIAKRGIARGYGKLYKKVDGEYIVPIRFGQIFTDGSEINI